MKKAAIWTSVVLAGSLAAGGVVYANTNDSDSKGVITKVVDGDTVDMNIAGTETRVRLLNIDTPETVHPDKAVECLGPEASENLKSLLKPGDKVDLKYDIERTDRYGRTLAAVYKDKSFINRDIAAAGLGVAVKYQPNVKYYDEILAAQREAEKATTGLFSPQIDCTIPAQLDDVLTALEEVPAEAAATTVEEAKSYAGEAAAAVAAGLVASKALKAMTPDTHPVTTALLSSTFKNKSDHLNMAVAQTQELEKAHGTRYNELVAEEKKKQEEAAKAKAKAEEEARAKAKKEAEAAEAAKQKAAQEKAAKEKAAAQKAAKEKAEKAAAQRKATAKPKTSTPKYVAPKTQAPRRTTPKKQYTPKKQSVPKNYNGPRCYAPGGKTWKPCG